MATCNSCGEAIEWVKSRATGKWMPLNVEPAPDGNLVIAPDGKLRGYDPSLDDDPPKPRRTSHFATCPQADRWRRV